MHEQSEVTPDPLADKLCQFTPDTTGFDRDALLFQAGRVSAHRHRLWPILASVLATSQALTLLFFLTRTPEETSKPGLTVQRNSPAEVESDQVMPQSASEPGVWSYRKPLITGNVDDLPQPQLTVNSMQADKVLTVISYFSDSFAE